MADQYPETKPLPFQYELAVLGEECGEVVQIVGKTMRFGHDSSSPNNPTQTNYDLLHEEVGDILAAIDFGVERGFLDRERLETRRFMKRKKLLSMAPPAIMPVMSTTPAEKPQSAQNWPIVTILIACFIAAIVALTFGIGLSDAEQKRLDVLTRTNACYAEGKPAQTCERIANGQPPIPARVEPSNATDLDAPLAR